MKILYYDCYAGISGDMHLGAMLDLGVPLEYLTAELSRLRLDHEFEIIATKKMKMGITGTKADVFPTAGQHEHVHEHEDSLTDQPEFPHPHSHTHHHPHTHNHGDEQQHQRNFGEIEGIIQASDLGPEVKERSIKMFSYLAKAEAKVHGIPVEEVHFHEVGAIDSIVDIVGAAICIEYLKPDRILCSPVQVGSGFVRCQHGIIPVPAPATAELLRNIPIKSGMVQFETTTPTGAAILAANVDEFTNSYQFSIDRIGYGLGTKDMAFPNALRVFLCNG